MGEHEFRIDESQRQLTLLALARLALEHPGFDYALTAIAKRLGEKNGETMYASFKELRADEAALREQERRAVVLALNWLDQLEALKASRGEPGRYYESRDIFVEHLRKHFRTDSGGASSGTSEARGEASSAEETPAPAANPPLEASAAPGLTVPGRTAEALPPRAEYLVGDKRVEYQVGGSDDREVPIDAGGYEDLPIRCGFGSGLKGQPVSIDGVSVSAFGGQMVVAEQKGTSAEPIVLGDAALATLELGEELFKRTGLPVEAFDNATAVEAREAKARAGDLPSLAWLIAKGLGELGWNAEEVGRPGLVRVDFGQGRAFCRYVTLEVSPTALESYQSSSMPSRWLVNVLRGYDDRLRGIS